MNKRILSIFAAAVCLFQVALGQELPPGGERAGSYLLGPGDQVTVKVLGEPQFDFVATIDETGQVAVPFVKEPLVAQCRTESELRSEVTKKLSFYLKSPQVNLQVTDRQSRPPVSIYGEVKLPAPVILKRKTTLLELIAFSGGVNEKSSGMVQVIRTRPAICTPGAAAAWETQAASGLLPTRSYSLSSLKQGSDESNPEIFPGDLIIVGKAPPVYVIGQVNALKEITMGENGLSLLEAIAQAGGFAPRAKSKDIKIRRLKSNSREREIISVNYQLIKDGKEKDVMLQPEDIVEVDKSPKSPMEVILELVSGTAKSATNFLPQRIMF
jgi:polysaccharide export outer membrane protein